MEGKIEKYLSMHAYFRWNQFGGICILIDDVLDWSKKCIKIGYKWTC